jgi:hypothetical protein
MHRSIYQRAANPNIMRGAELPTPVPPGGTFFFTVNRLRGLERRAKKWNPVFRLTGATTKESAASGDAELSPDAVAGRLARFDIEGMEERIRASDQYSAGKPEPFASWRALTVHCAFGLMHPTCCMSSIRRRGSG